SRIPMKVASPPDSRTRSQASWASRPAAVESTPPLMPRTYPFNPVSWRYAARNPIRRSASAAGSKVSGSTTSRAVRISCCSWVSVTLRPYPRGLVPRTTTAPPPPRRQQDHGREDEEGQRRPEHREQHGHGGGEGLPPLLEAGDEPGGVGLGRLCPL